MNSGVRLGLPDALREYLDEQEKSERKSQLRLMNALAEEYGFDAAVKAMDMSLSNGSINESDASILAARITGYGIDTPPEAGPPLSVYDDVLIHSRSQTGGAA